MRCAVVRILRIFTIMPSRRPVGRALLLLALCGLAPGCGRVAPPERPPSEGRLEAAAAAQPVAHPGDAWHVLSLGDQRVGFSRLLVEPAARGGRPVVRTTEDLWLSLQRFNQPLRMQIMVRTEETPDGRLLSYAYYQSNPPAAPVRTVGRIEGDRLVQETTIAGRTTTRSLDWDPGTRSSAWQHRSLVESPLQPGERRSFQAFLPEADQVTRIDIEAQEHETVRLPDGESARLLKVQVVQTLLDIPVFVWTDDAGRPVKTETAMMGLPLVAWRAEPEEALREIGGQQVDLGSRTLVPVDPIPGVHAAGKAVYRVTVAGEDPAQYLADDPRQRVRPLGDSAAEVTVTAMPLPESARPSPADPEYLQPTRFLESDDPRVIQHARQAAGDETHPSRIAARMEQYVHRAVSNKNFSIALASAAEVAESLEGDCTEHAVLLAAMLRAREIPSRVAVGLVYVEKASAFGWHMWTEALLDGQWIALDATLGREGIGAGHIKLADASFGDDSAAPAAMFLPLLKVGGNLRIEALRTE